MSPFRPKDGRRRAMTASVLLSARSGHLSAGPLHQFDAEITAHGLGGSGQGLERDRGIPRRKKSVNAARLVRTRLAISTLVIFSSPWSAEPAGQSHP
jgi:hypothetical protein